MSGPRQSGKTTLAKVVFPKYEYVSLENLDQREFARNDPRGFLERYAKPTIIDEAQKAPDLLSYLQTEVDERPVPGRYILTGSQQFPLIAKASQSLAGRAGYLQLLPFSIAELTSLKPLDPYRFDAADLRKKPKGLKLNSILFQGLYPRIYSQNLDPHDFLAAYTTAYLERDVREVLRVGDLSTFQKFIQLCAGRTGQILNFSNLAQDCGISHTTARHWLSVLQASSIVYLLEPYHKNFTKRIIKSPKLYFLDTGLACYLLRIRKESELDGHPLYGSIFETLIVSEMVKSFARLGDKPPLYFWRDQTGHEIDLVVDLAVQFIAIEIKSSKTISEQAFQDLQYVNQLKGAKAKQLLVYGGEDSTLRNNIRIKPWWQVS